MIRMLVKSVLVISCLILFVHVDWLYAAAPSITSLSPTSGAVTASVTITGANFGSTRGSSTVKFNGTAATPTSWSATSIVVPVPTGATTGNVVVTVSGVASNGKSFTVVPAPSITSLSPTSGAVTASVTITGTNFGSPQGSGTVKFNGTTATPTSWTATSIAVHVPTGATTGNVVVNASGVASNGKSFTVVPAPSITSLSPTSGAVGAPVTITGTNFGSTQGSGTVKFNGITAAPTGWGATSIAVPVPTGATTGNVVVNASGVASNGKSFTVLPTPTITSLSTPSGTVGTPVTITGTNFGSTKGTSTVMFNGTTATTTSWGATSIAVTVPAGATTGNVVVHASGVYSNGVNFTVVSLVSISVTPQSASIPLNSTQQLTATGTYSDNSTANITSSAVWSSTSPTIATVASNGVATAVGQGQTTIQATVGSVNGSTALNVTPSRFTFTGSLNIARDNHTATVLSNGKVLIVGGLDLNNNEIATSEIYDPVTGTFTTSGSLITPREGFTATLLPNGMVLIAGGYNRTLVRVLANAELYDPATGTFSAAGNLNIARESPEAVLLNNGMVLVAGGVDNTFHFQPTAELYNPTTGTFTTTGAQTTVAFNQTATLLADGTVLFAGGQDPTTDNAITGAEVYNPATGTFAGTGSLNTASFDHTATLLSNGSVLIAGGYTSITEIARAELYDPVARSFRTTGNLVNARFVATATLLSDGQVLVAGGGGPSGNLGTAELYDPASASFSLAGILNNPRSTHTASILNDGTVLVAGGSGTVNDRGVVWPSAELYQPSALPPPPISLQVSPASVNMQVGNTRQFTAVDSQGHPRTDVTWSVNSPGLAIITPNYPAIFTAQAPGQVIVTASDGTVTAQAQVTITSAGPISPGAVLWTVPPAASFLPLQVAQAFPSDYGADTYLTQVSGDGTQSFVQALRDDGEQLWQRILPALNTASVPDGNGGLIVTEHQTCNQGQDVGMSIVDLDGSSGEPLWQINSAPINQGPAGLLYCYPIAPQMAIRQDSSVVVSASGNTSGLPELMILNGTTGALITAPSIPTSSYTSSDGSIVMGYSPIGRPIVDSNGSLFVEYEVRTIAYPLKITSAALYLLEIASDYTQTTTQIASTAADQNLFPGRIIPDGQGGVLATWTIDPSNPPIPLNPYQAAHVVSGAVTAVYNLPFTPRDFVTGPDALPLNPTLTLNENGTAMATDGTSTGDITMPGFGPKVVSFNLATGAVNWTYQVSPLSTLTIIANVTGGGVLINDSQSGVVMLDPGGVPTQITGPLGGVPAYSWDGNWRLQTSQGISQILPPSAVIANSPWAFAGGNESVNGAAILQIQTTLAQGAVKQVPPMGTTLNTTYNSIELLTSMTPAQIFSTYIQTFLGLQPPALNTEARVLLNTNVTGPNQTVQFTLQGAFGSAPFLWVGIGQGPFSVLSERFDTTALVLSAVTLQGHPLEGWRYWRVHSVGFNDVVIETGAADVPGPTVQDYLGEKVMNYRQRRVWEQDFTFILNNIRANIDPNVTQGLQPQYNHLGGLRNPQSPTQTDILMNVCQSSWCN